ncbi:hypothetical protein [Dactylosporangium darangshiense]|uniref:hypothetical protein n=1 Tax=Dactylosporangium darangshiense TaxID=579108 RepID=UPI0031EE112B
MIYVPIPVTVDGRPIDPPAPAKPTATARTTATAVTLLVAMLGACGAGCLGGALGLFALFGQNHLDQVALLAGVAAFQAAGTLAVGIWATRRTSWAFSAVLLAPWLAGWAALIIWYWLRFPLWYIPWLTLGTLPLAVLSAWFWRNRRQRTARQAIVYLAALAIVLAANAAGVLNIAWDRTDAFGFRGQPTPEEAFSALTAASCVSDLDYHYGGGRVVRAECTSDYQGEYDKKTFDNTLCSEQPRAAFARWWQWNKEYQLDFSLGFTIERYSDMRNDPATLTVVMRLRAAFHPGEEEPYRIHVDKAEERWKVSAERALAGGWKICRVDIESPLNATFEKL